MSRAITSAGISVDHTLEELQFLAGRSGVPVHMVDSIVSYVMQHRPVGHFLTAVLSNDLKTACNRGDDENKHALYEYVFFLYNYAPAVCWGSPEAVEDWLRLGNPTAVSTMVSMDSDSLAARWVEDNIELTPLVAELVRLNRLLVSQNRTSVSISLHGSGGPLRRVELCDDGSGNDNYELVLSCHRS